MNYEILPRFADNLNISYCQIYSNGVVSQSGGFQIDTVSID